MAELRNALLDRLRKLGVEHRPAPGRDDGFAGLSYDGKSFAHFHNDHELDIRLTKAVIAREGLIHPTDSVGPSESLCQIAVDRSAIYHARRFAARHPSGETGD